MKNNIHFPVNQIPKFHPSVQWNLQVLKFCLVNNVPIFKKSLTYQALQNLGPTVKNLTPELYKQKFFFVIKNILQK